MYECVGLLNIYNTFIYKKKILQKRARYPFISVIMIVQCHGVLCALVIPFFYPSHAINASLVKPLEKLHGQITPFHHI